MAEALKSSGTTWAGLIPESWSSIIFSYAINDVRTGLNPRENFKLTNDDEYYYVTIRNFKDGKLYLDDKCDRINSRAFDIIQSRSNLKKGDILFASISDEANAYLLSEKPLNWNINESVFSIDVKRNLFNPRYLYYQIINPAYYDDLRLDATGSTFRSIKQNKLYSSKLVIPPLDEQVRIADFLDERCAEIDKLSEDIQKQIEILEDYKKSVIIRAVTKGLKPNADMNDSHISYVGNVPRAWKIHPVYYYFAERKHKNTSNQEQNLLSLSYGRIIRKDIDTNGGLLPASFSTYNIVERGDIIIRPTDLQNDKRSLRTGLVTERGIITSAYIGLRPLDDVNSSYYHYLLHAYDVMKVFYNMGNGVRQGLNYSEFSKLLVLEPPKDEQNEIVEYLDSKCDGIDQTINLEKERYEQLQTYKKTIIYEYVTGKKRVKGAL